MALARTVSPEALDQLGADDPRAQRARRDLQRIHRVMRTQSIMLSALDSALANRAVPRSIIELGAGDAWLLGQLAPRLARRWPHVELTLLDREPAVSAARLAALRDLGWQVHVVRADVMDWFARTDVPRYELALTTLFLHHFDARPLRVLLARVAAHVDALVAIEPRRSHLALAASHLVAVLGASAVTRADAVLSVHAGFRAAELSATWPPLAGWALREHAAAPFSHCFVAKRTGADAHA